MKGMKGKLLKKMKSMRQVGYLKLENRVLQVSASNRFVVNSCHNSFGDQIENKLVYEEKTEKRNSSVTEQEPEVIDVDELMRDLVEDEEEEEMGFGGDLEDKENIIPEMANKGSGCLKPKAEILGRVEREPREIRVSEASEFSEIKNRRMPGLSEIDVSSFRKPDLNSYSLFDPNLLTAFHQAVAEHFRLSEAERHNRNEEMSLRNPKEEEEEEREPPSKAPRIEQNEEEDEGDPLLEFEEKCPPGGSDCVILYTTTLRGIRKTFEGCGSIRFLLDSFRVIYFERDVSMHAEFREELRRVLGGGAVPPKLFVRGRYIGGAEEVLGLHEQGKLRPLFKDVPIDWSNCPCEGCGGVRFVVCFSCNGSHKVVGDDGEFNICPNCNENGLVICPLCC